MILTQGQSGSVQRRFWLSQRGARASITGIWWVEARINNLQRTARLSHPRITLAKMSVVPRVRHPGPEETQPHPRSKANLKQMGDEDKVVVLWS